MGILRAGGYFNKHDGPSDQARDHSASGQIAWDDGPCTVGQP